MRCLRGQIVSIRWYQRLQSRQLTTASASQTDGSYDQKDDEFIITVEQTLNKKQKPNQIDSLKDKISYFVHPDLPEYVTWNDYLQQNSSATRHPSLVPKHQQIVTVGAQDRSRKQLKSILKRVLYQGADAMLNKDGPENGLYNTTRDTTRNDPQHANGNDTFELCSDRGSSEGGVVVDTTGGVGGVLLLSGTHVLRSAPVVKSILPGWPFLLDTALAIREDNQQLLADTQEVHYPKLCCVANPNDVGSRGRCWEADNTIAKVTQGADMILTQPPLLLTQYMEWYHAVEHVFDSQASTKPNHKKLIAGLPVITSSRSLAFWYQLIGAPAHESRQTTDQLRAFVDAEAAGGDTLARFLHVLNMGMLDNVLALDKIGGVHLMALSNSGRAKLPEMIKKCREQKGGGGGGVWGAADGEQKRG